MKKNLLFLFLLATTLCTKSQVVFSPPGAEWHYAFSYFNSPYVDVFNQKIVYTHDSVIGQDTFKVLQHDRFFLSCDSYMPYHAKVTLIKQRGDTVFFRNVNTNHGWQILYNFDCFPGQSWQNTIYESASTSRTFTTSVQAINFVTINNQSVMQMTVTTSTFTGSLTITERLGSYGYLFCFTNSMEAFCDADIYDSPLCYKDDSFGLYKYFSTIDCDYQTVGIKSNASNLSLSIYPNPAGNVITLEAGSALANCKIVATDMLGKEVLQLSPTFLNNKASITLSELQKGIYFLRITDQDKVIAYKKIMKE